MAAPWYDMLFTGTINPAGDTDLSPGFNLTAGEDYIFELEGTTLPDPRLRLLDSAFAPVRIDNNSGPGLDSLIDFTPAVGGMYFLEVAGVGVGDYRLTARHDEAADDINTRDSIVVGGQRLGTINNVLDRDFFQVHLVQNTVYSFDVVGNTLADPTLAVHNSTGAVLAFNDDLGGSLNPHISFTAPNTGNFYLDVTGFNGNTGSYTLTAA